MMNIYDLMNAHAVKVNSGSGVLISALSQEYSYVLTARHVVKDSSQHTVLNHEGEQIDVIQTYLHPDSNVDCAVIIIPYQESINLSLYIGQPHPQAQLMMVGYPDSRDKEANFHDKVKQQDAEFTSWVKGEIVISAKGMPDKEMIDGFSGAGVYCLDNENPCLIAIEYRMDGKGDEMYSGRLRCKPIHWYQELVEHYSLASIMPSFLECFSRLKDETFNYDVPGTKFLNHIKEELGGFIDEILEDEMIKPSIILNKYKASLLFAREQHSSLQDIKLWISYLEFMTISVLLDDPTKADSNYFSGLDKKRRMVFSKSKENWIGELRSLFELADSMLDEGGSLIIDNYEAAPALMPVEFQIKSILQNISRPRPGGSRLKITQSSRNEDIKFKFIHIRALHRVCILEKIEDFHEANPVEYLNMLRGFYNVHVS